MAANARIMPPMLPFPRAVWLERLSSDDLDTCLMTWTAYVGAQLGRSDGDFLQQSTKDASLGDFLRSYAANLPASFGALHRTHPDKARRLHKDVYGLCLRLLGSGSSSLGWLMEWDMLVNLSLLFSRRVAQDVLQQAWKSNRAAFERSLATCKAALIEDLDKGISERSPLLEDRMRQLNRLLHVSPETAQFFMAGSDFVDAMMMRYRIMDPPLRQILLSTMYVSLTGLVEVDPPNFSSLVDQLYNLKAAAEKHRAGPTSANDSLVAEFVSITPIISHLRRRLDMQGASSNRSVTVLSALEAFRKPAAMVRPPGRTKAKPPLARAGGSDTQDFLHVHRLSLITQIRDLFPDLGAGYVVKLLDVYQDNAEEVIAHLLDGSLPAHLTEADKSEKLLRCHSDSTSSMPNAAPSHARRGLDTRLPERRNIYDDDDLDTLTHDTSRLHIGKSKATLTADDMLIDKTNAPNKSAILAALAAFDSDDDERDDTYDVEDVGGTVDNTVPAPTSDSQEARELSAEHTALLWQAYKNDQSVFDRDAAARRRPQRSELQEVTGLSDEIIEGWAIMLRRDPRQLKRLEDRYESFSGEQAILPGTAWRAGGTDEESTPSGSALMQGTGRGRAGRSRGRARGRGAGRGRGGVEDPSAESKDTDGARRRKEASKGSSANHNRRDQRARKMARGGFAG